MVVVLGSLYTGQNIVSYTIDDGLCNRMELEGWNGFFGGVKKREAEE